MSYAANSDGTCPHCDRSVHFMEVRGFSLPMGENDKGQKVAAPIKNGAMAADWGDEENLNYIFFHVSRCPSCKMPIFYSEITEGGKTAMRLVFPFVSSRRAPAEVPEDIAKDFNESVMVLPFSENASAALSRRCLEKTLTEKGYTHPMLSKKVEEALRELPDDLKIPLDMVREIGNFGAHPIKDENSGIIVDVEPGEAGFALDVLEMLFEYYFIRPSKSKQHIDKINEKLIGLGRRPLKT